MSELTGELSEELDHAQEESGQEKEAAGVQTKKAEEVDAGGMGDTETEREIPACMRKDNEAYSPAREDRRPGA